MWSTMRKRLQIIIALLITINVRITSSFCPPTHFAKKGSLVIIPNNKNYYKHNGISSSHRERRLDNTIALALSSSSADSSTRSKAIQRKINLHIWIISLSTFIIANAKYAQPRPEFLLHALNRKQWSLVHAICSMLFSGTIILSAMIEYLVVASKQKSVIKFWFIDMPQRLDAKVVLPALTGAIVSGVGQAAYNYGGLASAPKHIKASFHLLLTFGIWWGITDVTSQHKALDVVQTFQSEEKKWVKATDKWIQLTVGGNDTLASIPKVLKRRVFSNVVSCLFIGIMYSLMVLKPGFGT